MSGLEGLVVVSFESRRPDEMGRLIETHGGTAIVAPSIREVPLEPGPDAVEFGQRLRAGEIDGVLFLSRGGVTWISEVLGPVVPPLELKRALAALPIGARGPKTAEALVEVGLREHVVSDPPHTWRQLFAAYDRAHRVAGREVAVVEHGVPNLALRAALMDAGAHVFELSVYRWVLPEDTGPLVSAIEALVEGTVDVALFTNGAQVDSVIGVAAEQDLDETVRRALGRAVVGAVGEVTAERLRAFGIEPDIIPARGRMDDLVRATSERARAIVRG